MFIVVSLPEFVVFALEADGAKLLLGVDELALELLLGALAVVFEDEPWPQAASKEAIANNAEMRKILDDMFGFATLSTPSWF